MAWEQPLFKISLAAGKDLTARQYNVVRMTTALKATYVSCAAVANRAVGILQNEPTSGVEAEILVIGVSKVQAGAAISKNALLGLNLASTTVPGSLIAATTARYAGTRPVGIALEAAGQAGDIITALVNFIPAGLASS